jgi:hypothetical protein
MDMHPMLQLGLPRQVGQHHNNNNMPVVTPILLVGRIHRATNMHPNSSRARLVERQTRIGTEISERRKVRRMIKSSST